MTKLLARRLLFGVLIMLAVSILVFIATEALPGNAGIAKLGRSATPAALAAFKAHYHLNESIIAQYLRWLGELVQGNLGVSLASSLPVTTLIGQRIGNSFALLVAAAVIGVPIGWAIGCLAAMRRDGNFDRASSLVVLAMAAMPEFVIGITVIVLLATNVLHLFPATSLLNPGQSAWTQLNLVALPAITLAIAIIPYIARMARASMIDVLDSEYVAMARLKGVRESRVIVRHAFMNTAAPTLQAIALSLAYLTGGTVVIETVYQYPGIGLALVTAIQDRDLPVVQALVLLICLAYVVITISADMLTVLVSPRLRTRLGGAR